MFLFFSAIEELSEISSSFFIFHEEKSSIPDLSENEFINLSHPFLSCQSPTNLAGLNIESEPSKHQPSIVLDLESTPKTNNSVEVRSRHRAKISHTADFKMESPNKRSCTSPGRLNFQLNQEKSSLKKRSSFRRKKARGITVIIMNQVPYKIIQIIFLNGFAKSIFIRIIKSSGTIIYL